MTTPTDKPSAWYLLTQSPVRIQLLLFLVLRTVLNTGFRMIYPFKPAIARGLGVEESAIDLAVTARSTLGLFSPLIGTVGDVRGRKVAILAGLLIFVGGMALVFLLPSYPTVLLAMIATTASKVLIDPAVYAYLADHVDYRQRGLAIGITEFGWSGAFLLGIPVVGWFIANAGWSSPFLALSVVGVGLLALVYYSLPADTPHHEAGLSALRRGLAHILGNPAALAGVAVGVLISASNEIVNIVFGRWMEGAFAVQLLTLAAASAAIGASELIGEGLVAGLVDRIGKRRSVALGLLIYAGVSLLLPVIGVNQDGAILGLFLFYLGFEFALVASLPLMTELAPQARATLMASNGAGHALGRLLGSLIGPALFAIGSLGLNALIACILNLVALALLLLFIREQPAG